MLNKHAFTTIELTAYLVVASIVMILLSLIIKHAQLLRQDNDIYLLQNISVLQHDLVKYKEIKSCEENILYLEDDIKLSIKDNQVYQTPGFMPYLQKTSNLRFICLDKAIKIKFTYQDKDYEHVIFVKK